MTKTIKIEGMTCMHCVKSVTDTLSKIKKIESVNVSLENNEAIIVLNKDIKDQKIINAIDEAGYKVLEII